MLQALAHEARDDLPEALAALGRSSRRAPEPDSYVRLYLDEGAPMLALLHHAAGAPDPVVQARPDSCSSVLEHRRGGAPSRSTSLGRPVEPRASSRCCGCSTASSPDPEIARQLYVSVNTLRTHTKRIFTKLDVTTRPRPCAAPASAGSSDAVARRCHIVSHIMW